MKSDNAVADWWRTAVIEMRPGEIRLRGYAVEELAGRATFAETIWLMLRGELPSVGEAKLLEAALTAGVDHGPQAPGIAVARMVATCGVGLNGAMAAGVGALGDIHGGAGEQAAEMFRAVLRESESAPGTESDSETESDNGLQLAADSVVQRIRDSGQFVPGFGHRFHPVDPRAPRLLELIENAKAAGVVSGQFAAAARAVGTALESRARKQIPLNIDGATAAVFSELNFPPPLCRGLFCLSRSVGILAHAWEQTQQGGRNKGPAPPENLWTYDGPPPRPFPNRGKGCRR